MTTDSGRTVLTEICVASLEGARIAEQAGADRIELNAALSLGGVTPSVGLLRCVRASVDLPIVTMLRPRESGFCYSSEEFLVMLEDAEQLICAGTDAIAFGILDHDGHIDTPRCRRVVDRIAGRVECVFHRAFDLVPDPIVAVRTLEELGFDRVMTSGQARSATEGAKTIHSLCEVATRIRVLVAGGVRPHNAAKIVQQTGCRELHAALTAVRTDPSVTNSTIAFSAARGEGESEFRMTDEVQVRALVRAANENRQGHHKG